MNQWPYLEKQGRKLGVDIVACKKLVSREFIKSIPTSDRSTPTDIMATICALTLHTYRTKETKVNLIELLVILKQFEKFYQVKKK